MSRRRPTPSRPRPSRRPEGRDDLWGCLGLLGLVVAMGVSVLLVVLVGDPTFDRFGPYLASLSPAARALWGVLVGVGAALPLYLLLSRVFRRLLAWPLSFYGFTAWVYVTILWLPPRWHGPGYEEARFRSEADWYVLTSVLSFHLALLFLFRLALRAAPPPPPPPPAPPRSPRRRR